MEALRDFLLDSVLEKSPSLLLEHFHNKIQLGHHVQVQTFIFENLRFLRLELASS